MKGLNISSPISLLEAMYLVFLVWAVCCKMVGEWCSQYRALVHVQWYKTTAGSCCGLRLLFITEQNIALQVCRKVVVYYQVCNRKIKLFYCCFILFYHILYTHVRVPLSANCCWSGTCWPHKEFIICCV